MGILLSILLGLLPMLLFAGFIYWLDRYEKEPILLLGGVFTWGAFIASGSAYVLNTLFGSGVFTITNSQTITALTTGVLFAPVIEESLKGLAVLIVYLVFLQEFDSILDGIIYAAITALGFAAAENAFYIYTLGYAEGGIAGMLVMAFVRIILVGWQHPFYTSFIGIGLAVTRMSKQPAIKLAAPLAGWSTAVLAHSIHNALAHTLNGTLGLLVGTSIDWVGWLTVLVILLLSVRNDQRTLEKQLLEEVKLGTITYDQYRTACSAWAQTRARFQSLLSHRYRQTSRFYQVAAELAHKKHQRSVMGEETGNTTMIQGLQSELSSLSVRATS